MTGKDRRADRHTTGNQVGVSVRLDRADHDRLEAARTWAGVSRRKAVITAIREWLDRNEPEGKP